MLTGCFVSFLFYFVFAATKLFHFFSRPPNDAAELDEVLVSKRPTHYLVL